MAKSSGPPAGNPPTSTTLTEAQELLGRLAEEAAASNEMVDRLGVSINRMQTALQAVQTVIQGVSAISNVAHLALDGFQIAVQGVANQIGGLVRLANPGVLDRFQKAFAAFQAQLGETFLPVLVGLTAVVQVVANALAGLTPRGRLFIVFLAGAAAGLAATVTVGGVFVAILGTVTGGLIAGALAAEVFATGLAGATAGFSAVGAAIGAVLSGLVTVGASLGGASAGGVAALALASGGMETFTKALEPFLKVLIGALDSAGAALLPELGKALEAITPAVTQLMTELVQYLPLFGELLVSFATNILPPLIQATVEMLRAFLPVAVVLTKLLGGLYRVAGGVIFLTTTLIQLFSVLSGFGALSALGRQKPTGQTGNAPAPVTSASYGGIEDLFRKSNEQSVLGLSGVQEDPFAKTMKDQSVVNQWAQGVVAALGSLVTGESFSAAVARGMMAAIRGSA